MIPYYDHGGITLYHCAWEDLLPTLPPASVGLFLVDPNYGTTQLVWDTPWDWPRFWKESNRACPPNALQVCFSAQPFTTDLITSNRKSYRYEVVWAKTMPTGFLDANRRPLRAHETLQVFCRAFGKSTYHPQMVPCAPEREHRIHRGNQEGYGAQHYGSYNQRPTEKTTIVEKYPTSVWTFSNGHGNEMGALSDHETAKPLPLLERACASWSNPGDLICDPGFGRGTTARAAKNLHRRFVGCDLREECCELAARWCEQEVLPMEAVS